jgi:hypothetical protein
MMEIAVREQGISPILELSRTAELLPIWSLLSSEVEWDVGLSSHGF